MAAKACQSTVVGEKRTSRYEAATIVLTAIPTLQWRSPNCFSDPAFGCWYDTFFMHHIHIVDRFKLP